MFVCGGEGYLTKMSHRYFTSNFSKMSMLSLYQIYAYVVCTLGKHTGAQTRNLRVILQFSLLPNHKPCSCLYLA